MQGYQLSFFTQQDHMHRGHSLAHWLVEEARRLGIAGATMIAAAEGFGHHRRLHSAGFFELADQPVEVVMVVTTEESDRLFERLMAEGVHVFYVKAPVEFGMLGEPPK